MEEDWPPEEGAGQGLAHRLHEEGLAGPLRWLENCLRRTAGDREEDGVSHPVPLVPLSEENEDAMEDRCFQALLRQLGLRPPASEQVWSPSPFPSPSPRSRRGPAASPLSAQESFWRIPAALTPQQLRRAAASIAHHGPDPPGPPQGLPEPPRPLGSPDVGLSGATPCPHCCSEEPVPVPSPVQSGTKRRRELDSEDED
ncbi:TIM protein, partial [Himantopus himantopus]|nr:TIM protein [Himantopus himantopus]